MVCCSVVGCKSRSGVPNIRLHRFPVARVKLWGRILNRKNYTSTVNSRICSEHCISGFPGWEPSDPDWVPTLKLPKCIKISEANLPLEHQRAARTQNRAKIKDEKYKQFMSKRVHERRLATSLRFHDYMERNVSGKETSETVNLEANETPVQIPAQTLMSEGKEMSTQIANETLMSFGEDMPTQVPSSGTLSGGKEISEQIESDCFISEHKSAPILTSRVSEGTQTDYLDLEMENRNLRETISELEEHLKQQIWNADKLKDNDEMTKFYTGLPTYAVFLRLFSFFQEKAEKMMFKKGKKTQHPGKKKRSFKLPLIDQFLAVMMRLKVGLFAQDIADRFNISPSTFSNMFQTWIKLMELELKEMFPFPSKALVDKYMPQCYLKYPNTRIIIDCTELFIERSTSLIAQNLTFSNYKQHNTIKFVVGITPGGVISFVSEGWGGRVSDKAITNDSKLIMMLDEFDNVVADKGFLIEDLLKEKNCTLNLPPFLKNKPQFSEKEIIDTRRIAELRIHVERAIGRVKKFHIFDGIMPLTIAKMSSSIFAVCCYITNIYEPLL